MTFVLDQRAVSSTKSSRSTTFRFRKKSVGLGPDSSARRGQLIPSKSGGFFHTGGNERFTLVLETNYETMLTLLLDSNMHSCKNNEHQTWYSAPHSQVHSPNVSQNKLRSG